MVSLCPGGFCFLYKAWITLLFYCYTSYFTNFQSVSMVFQNVKCVCSALTVIGNKNPFLFLRKMATYQNNQFVARFENWSSKKLLFTVTRVVTCVVNRMLFFGLY